MVGMNHYQFGRLPGLMELTMMERRGEITPVQFMEFAAARRKATSGAKDSEPSKSQTCRIGGKVYKIAKTRNGKALQCGGKKRVQLKDAAKVQALRDAGGEFDAAIAGKPYKVNAEMLLAANKMGVSSRQLAAGRVPADLQTPLRRKFNEMTIGESVTKPEVAQIIKAATSNPVITPQPKSESIAQPLDKLGEAARAAKTDLMLPSGIAEVDPKNIQVDPKRFQYKVIGESTKTGEVGSLSGVRKWDPNLAGIVQVWHDRNDGNVYVINGHNRLALANKMGVGNITAKFINAESPKEARAIGALTNIAEGRGTSIDAAKFFRDSGLTREDLERKGIPMREAIAKEALALADLSPSLFMQVTMGSLPTARAASIGQYIKEHAQQEDLAKMIEDRERKGRKVSAETIEELARSIAGAPKKEESGGLFDLLGMAPQTRSLAVEKAEVTSSIKRQIMKEFKLFGTVAKGSNAAELERAGNSIDVESSAELATTASKALRAFEQEKMLAGKVGTILNSAAERVANGEKIATIQREIYPGILAELRKTYLF